MIGPAIGRTFVAVSIALAVSACASPKEKSAPCKRPTELTFYAAEGDGSCGPMRTINTNRQAALSIIDKLAAQPE